MADLEFETSASWRPLSRNARRIATPRRGWLWREFLDLREKVALIVSQIAKDIPGLRSVTLSPDSSMLPAMMSNQLLSGYHSDTV
jgi:hypothetical protein